MAPAPRGRSDIRGQQVGAPLVMAQVDLIAEVPERRPGRHPCRPSIWSQGALAVDDVPVQAARRAEPVTESRDRPRANKRHGQRRRPQGARHHARRTRERQQRSPADDRDRRGPARRPQRHGHERPSGPHVRRDELPELRGVAGRRVGECRRRRDRRLDRGNDLLQHQAEFPRPRRQQPILVAVVQGQVAHVSRPTTTSASTDTPSARRSTRRARARRAIVDPALGSAARGGPLGARRAPRAQAGRIRPWRLHVPDATTGRR